MFRSGDIIGPHAEYVSVTCWPLVNKNRGYLDQISDSVTSKAVGENTGNCNTSNSWIPNNQEFRFFI